VLNLPPTANFIERIAILEHRIADVQERISSFRLRGLDFDASEKALRALQEARDGYVALMSLSSEQPLKSISPEAVADRGKRIADDSEATSPQP
jgi:hypothetical protein